MKVVLTFKNQPVQFTILTEKRKKFHLIVSMDVENALYKIQYSFIFSKSPSKPGIEVNNLSLKTF